MFSAAPVQTQYTGDSRTNERRPDGCGRRRTERRFGQTLAAHRQATLGLDPRQLFAADSGRGERLTAQAAGICPDHSKNRVKDKTLGLLLRPAGECGLRERIAAMFRGDQINSTEARAVPHAALRAPESERIVVSGVDIVPQVHAVLDRMAAYFDLHPDPQEQAQRVAATLGRTLFEVPVGFKWFADG